MTTDKDKLMRGVRFMALSFPFIFAGPVLLYAGFGEGNSQWWLFAGGLCSALAVFLVGRGLFTVVSAFFDH